MALKRADVRKIFEGIEGVNDTHIDQVMDALHGEIDPLKDQLSEAQRSSGTDAQKWKDKYDSEHAAYESYKSEQTKKDTAAKKSAALEALLKDKGKLSEAGLKKALKYQSLDDIELDSDGKIKNASDLVKNIHEEWADYVTEEGTEGAGTKGGDGAGHAGGAGSGKKMTREEILKISDPTERQEAIANNLDVFGY